MDDPLSAPNGCARAQTDGTAEWDCRAIGDIAVMLHRYLAERDPPQDSQIAAEMAQWAASLQRSAQARRAALRVARLRAI